MHVCFKKTIIVILILFFFIVTSFITSAGNQNSETSYKSDTSIVLKMINKSPSICRVIDQFEIAKNEGHVITPNEIRFALYGGFNIG